MNTNNSAVVKRSFVILFSILVSIPQIARASLAGGYTVDAKSPANSNSYKSLTAIISDLSQGIRPDGGPVNGPGISANVIISVAKGSGPYNEQIVIPAINGLSSSNQIVIDGNDELLTFMPSPNLMYVVKFDGASFITFKDFAIEYQGKTGGRNIQISNHCKDLIIEGCTLTQPENETINHSTAFIALTTYDNNLDVVGVPGERITITKNILSNSQKRGVYCGIYLGYHADSMIEAKTEISYNLIEDFSNQGISSHNAVNQTIVHNEIRNNFGTSSTLTGIWLDLEDRPLTQRIDSNYLHHFKPSSLIGFQGIRLQISSSNGNGLLSISGNRLIFDSIPGSGSGIYIYNDKSSATSEVEVSHNHVQFHAAASDSNSYIGIYSYILDANELSTLSLKGNKIDIVSGGSATGVYQRFKNTVLANPINIFNNILSVRGTNTVYVCRIQGSDDQLYRVYYNTISSDDYTLTAPKGTQYYLFYGYDSDFDLKNNLFHGHINEGDLTSLLFGGNGIVTCDYNSFFLKNNGSGSISYSGGSSHGYLPTFSDFYQKMSGGNDINLDPLFKDIAGCDFTPTEERVMNKGKPLSEVTADISGNTRSPKTPDMGAIETSFLTANLVDDSIRFTISPNPARRILQIQSDFKGSDGRVTILNSTGELLMEKEVVYNTSQIDLDVSNLAQGVYFILYESENRNQMRKVVITR